MSLLPDYSNIALVLVMKAKQVYSYFDNYALVEPRENQFSTLLCSRFQLYLLCRVIDGSVGAVVLLVP